MSSGDGPRARTETMARILNVSVVHLGRLAKQGVIPQQVGRGEWDVVAVANAYIRHIEDRVAEKVAKVGDVKSEELQLIRARRLKAEAETEAQTMKNAALRGDLLPRAAVIRAGQEVLARVRARLLAVPVKAAPRVVGRDGLPEVEGILKEHVHEALAELAGLEVVADDAAAAAGDDGSGVAGDDDAAAPADGERVGGSKPVSKPRGKRRTG